MSTRQSRGNVDVAWLAGIIEGEGHLGIHWSAKEAYALNVSLQPTFMLGNTDLAMTDKAIEVIFQITHKKPKMRVSKKDTGARKFDYYCIALHSIKDISKLCKAILPFMSLGSKREQAKLLIEFHDVRKASRHNHDHISKCRYGPAEADILERYNKYRRNKYPQKLFDILRVVETE